MKQEPLFYTDFRGSVRHLISHLGGAASVGMALRPTLSADKAEKWVSECLNPRRDTKFDFEDLVKILAMGREVGLHFAVNQLCEELDYEHPDIKAPKSARQVLAERRLKLAQEQKALADEEAALERSEAATQVRTLRSGT